MDIKFSVAVHAYNSAAFIGETIEAILSQTYPPAEVVVVDDGSTDETPAIVKTFIGRVAYHRIDNVGSAAARKTAVERCQHEWIATCDSDDVWLPCHLERFAELIRQFPDVNFIFSDFTSFGSAARPNYTRLAEAPSGWLEKYTTRQHDGFVLLKDSYRAFLSFNPAWASGWAFRAHIYHAIGGIDPKYRRAIAEDTDFCRRLLLHPDTVVAGDTQVTWKYRRHSANTSASQWRNLRGKARILQDHLDANLIPDALESDVREEIAKTRLEAFNTAYWDRDWQGVPEAYKELPRPFRNIKTRARLIVSWILYKLGSK